MPRVSKKSMMNLPIQANNLVLSAQDEDEAIDQSNIMNGRTRHAEPQTSNRYDEGPNEDDLPEEAL
ncbi:hypothetical protein N7481_009881 [Penicillium waksmanii]|uniref:uncharacterized protein n=1 Tax=Penicillium waksmanii TaxID=69791 RepID=UPI00254906CD|nr:uncharacterized protein N7481_009881 [Penicillium waksmanii]KAJ5976174.1 hypothetical protein N7481_009881 [Penicillium waksmanii]